MVRKIIFFLIALILWIPAFAGMVGEAFAVEEQDFATSYDVTYDVGNDGITLVTQRISLRNLTSQYFATQFSLNIGSTQVFDVVAEDGGGSMEVKQELVGTFTKLTVKFNQQIAGKDKILTWNLKFKSKDFARKLGKIWEVTLPKIAPSTNLENYNLNLLVPQSFGQPQSVTPIPQKVSESGGKFVLNFNKNQLTNSGVLVTFGGNQIFDFILKFHLQNQGLASLLTNIALPPDSEYQDVSFQSIEPRPINVTLDGDGNYLAWYKLSRNQTLDVKVTGLAKLYLRSRVKNPYLNPQLEQKYTQPLKFWESNHPVLKTKLDEVLGLNPPTTNFEKARLIHRFVSSSLKYNTGRLNGLTTERLGALTALNNPNEAVCTEFTDLFIALSRAAGIPAREVNGFAYSSNPGLRPLSLQKDILHSWPEVWDSEKGWVMVDPTWEATTGGVDYFSGWDLNHFTFVIKGLSSEKPVPAGSYKIKGMETKDVDVNFTEKEFGGRPRLNITIDSPKPLAAGLPAKIRIRIENQGDLVYQSSTFTLVSGRLTILDGSTKETGPIPAFGFGEFEYNVRTKSLFDNFDDILEVNIAGQKIRKDIEIRPFILFRNFPIGLIAVIGLIVLVYFSLLGSFVYRKRFKKAKVKSGRKK